MEFSRQEYWSELLRPPPGDLPDPGIEPMSLASPALAPPGKPTVGFTMEQFFTQNPTFQGSTPNQPRLPDHVPLQT